MITNDRVSFLLNRAKEMLAQLPIYLNDIELHPHGLSCDWVIPVNHRIAYLVAVEELLMLEESQTERSSNYARINTIIKNIENQETKGVKLESFIYGIKKTVNELPDLIDNGLLLENNLEDFKDIFERHVDRLQGYFIYLQRKTSMDTFHPLESDLINSFKKDLELNLHVEIAPPSELEAKIESGTEPVRTIGDLIRQQMDADTLKYIHRPEDPKRFEWDIGQALSSLESLVQRMKSASGIMDNQSMTDIHMQMQGIVGDLNHIVGYVGCVVQATGYPYKIVHEVPDPLGMDEDFDDNDFGDNQDRG